MLDAETIAFVERAVALPPQVLTAAFDRQVDLRGEGGKEASRAAVPSAAENSDLEHRLNTALRARTDELGGTEMEAYSVIQTAARAILKRAKLTEAQYDVLVRPFADAGVEVPSHPAADS
ncbi:hypothetical protein GE115_15890 [Agromyces sp. CFH 90414]|uniref:Uncharacterized protein n=1 Tax=Agromyces agglutinans TaxID=2662258 RepID=A0A6I2FL35_9MICO|nr:hypothetical protein [Agromyces agglutinans]MRG61338.1 hypothetical protein [Agromyces agglutinans]